MIKRFLILSVLLSAFSLRFYKFYETFGFYGDQGQDLLAIHHWFATGEIPLQGILTSIGTFHMGPLYYYLIAPFVFLFNQDPIAPVYLFLICGVLTVWISYLFLKKFVDIETAIISSIIFSLSPHLIFLSKGAYLPNLQPIATLLMLFFLTGFIFKYKERKEFNFREIFWCYFLIGAGLQFHYTFLANLITVTILLIIFSIKIFKNIKFYLYSIFGFLIPLVPFLIGQFKNNFSDFYGIWNYLILSGNQKRIILFQTIVDRLTFPFTIYFSIDSLPYYINFLAKPLFVLIILVAGFMAFTKNRFSLVTKILLSFLLISELISFFGKTQFWWWYYDYFSIVILLLISIIISFFYHLRKFKFIWLGIFSIFIWWEIFSIPKLYQIQRSVEMVKDVSQKIFQDAKEKKIASISIFVESTVSLHQGFEYRSLLERDSLKTTSAEFPKEADYLIKEDWIKVQEEELNEELVLIYQNQFNQSSNRTCCVRVFTKFK